MRASVCEERGVPCSPWHLGHLQPVKGVRGCGCFVREESGTGHKEARVSALIVGSKSMEMYRGPSGAAMLLIPLKIVFGCMHSP